MEWMKKHYLTYEIIAILLLVLAFVSGIMAMFESTKHFLYDIPFSRHLFLIMISMACWMIAQILFWRLDKLRLFKQFLIIDMILAVTFGILCVIGQTELLNAGHGEFLRSYAVIGMANIIPFFFVFFNKKSGADRISWENCWLWIVRHKFILGAELITFAVVIIQSGSKARWDGAYVYQYIHDEISLSDIFNLSQLSFCGHIDMTYIGINKILAMIFGDLSVGMTVGTILLLLGSMACIYGIVKCFVRDRSDLEYAIMAALYVASPFVLGLSGYNYWDSWVILLFPILIYSSMRELWIVHLVMAVVFCYIKETAIVAYAGYAAGMVIADWIQNRDWKHVVKSKQYWGMLVVGLSWLYLYIKLPNWDGVGGFTLDGEYILQKLKVMYILNFNWILSILTLVAMIILLKKKRMINNLILPILCSDVLFVLFSCLFETVNHARYIDTHIIVLNLMAIIGIQSIGHQSYRYIMTILVIIMLTVSNYSTIDPLTLAAFDNYHVGKINMISTCQGEYLSDSMVYNQQYRYFDKALNKALSSIIEQDSIIFYPVIADRTWFFLGTYCKPDEIVEQYWDEKQKSHILYENNNSISFSMCNVTSAEKAVNELHGKAGYYFYIPCAGEKIAEDLRKQTRILEEQDFTYGGWTVTRIKFQEK